MGLPTTANYIVVSSLLAPVIVTLGQESGLIVPLIAVHLFVFYFGIMADVTPPVGLASFAAAAVSGADPIKTGFVAFFYSLRTAILPFLFIFNTDLLLINVDWLHGILVFVISTIGMLVFTAATQGFFLTRCRLIDIALLLLVAFTLFRPGFWMDQMIPPYKSMGADLLLTHSDALEHAQPIKLHISGFDQYGEPREFVTLLKMPSARSLPEQIESMGLSLVNIDGKVIVDHVSFGSKAEQAGLDFDQTLESIDLPVAQPAKEWMFIPALLLLMLVVLLQTMRRNRSDKLPTRQPALP